MLVMVVLVLQILGLEVARAIAIRWDMFRIILAWVWVKRWWLTVRAIVFIWCNRKGDGVQRCLPMRLI